MTRNTLWTTLAVVGALLVGGLLVQVALGEDPQPKPTPACDGCSNIPGNPSQLSMLTDIAEKAQAALKATPATITQSQHARIFKAIGHCATNVPPFKDDQGNPGPPDQHCSQILQAWQKAQAPTPDWNACAGDLEHGH